MLCVDRIEGEYAVCYDGMTKLDIFLSDIRGSVHEGDVLVKKGDRYETDSRAAEKRKKDVLRKQNELWE